MGGSEGGGRELHLHFYRSPVDVVGGPGVSAVRLERTQLQQEDGVQRAVGTRQYHLLPAHLLLKSIGYRSLPLSQAPFDPARGIIPNT